MSDESLLQRVEGVREQIAAAARRTGRDPAAVTLVVVTKAAGAEVFPELVAAGVADVGESRVQQALSRSTGWERAFRWHLVGHLQGNKARRAVAHFDVFHGIDSLPLLRRLDVLAAELGRHPEVLLQVNTSGEASKHGLRPHELGSVLRQAEGLRHLHLVGLMTMAPTADEAEAARGPFRALVSLRDEHGGAQRLPELSMGMTDDFAVAVEEGATMVRVGRRIVAPGAVGVD